MIIETPGELLLKVLQGGKVSTNIYLRRLHNFCLDMNYPERFANLALGHNSKAVHRAYSRNAKVTLPPLEDYEKERSSSANHPVALAGYRLN